MSLYHHNHVVFVAGVSWKCEDYGYGRLTACDCFRHETEAILASKYLVALGSVNWVLHGFTFTSWSDIEATDSSHLRWQALVDQWNIPHLGWKLSFESSQVLKLLLPCICYF